VVGAGEARAVHCPCRDRDMPLQQCLGCARYESLAIDPAGKHVYVDCEWDGPGDLPPLCDGAQGSAGPSPAPLR
jgi:hypothetical protein